MEASPHRLDTGGLSQAALRILAALRSESLGAPSDPNHCRPRRQMERFDSQMATWREEYTDGASAEIRPWFILSVSPDHDGPDQLLFPTTQQQNSGRTAPPVDCHQASSGLTDDKFYEHKRESAGNIDSGRTAELNVKESANGIRQSFESDTRNNLAPKLSDSKDKKPGVEGENIFEARAENNCGMEDLPDCGELKEKSKTNVRTAAEEIGPEIKEDKRSKGELQLNSEDIRNSAETSESERLPAPTRANQCVTRRSGFKPPLLCGNQQHNDNAQVSQDTLRILKMTTPCDTTLTVTKTNYDPPGQRPTASKVARESHFQLPPLIPSFSMKRKHKALQDQKETPNSKISLTWQIPKREPSFPAPTEPPQGGICEWKKAKMATSVSALRSKTVESAARRDTQQHLKHKNVKKCDIAESKSDREDVEQVREELSASEVRADKAVSLTSDSRVADSEKMNADEKVEMLKKAQQAKVLLLTLVHRDGTTQFDPQRKLSSTVCGLFVLMKAVVHCSSSADDSLGPDDILLYVKLQQTPAWAQQHTHHQSQHSFSRDFLQLLLSSSELVVCYKAKDLLRTALNIYKQHLNWKQVAGCHIQDPQVSAWLLDAADPSSCFQSLLHKHFRRQFNTPALGSHKVTQVISGLNWLLRLNLKLNSDLKNQKLWCLFTNMELKMIPVLAAMESHRIHVDKETLKKTSDLLGTKMKQLEQEAHQAAGQKFLLTSNTQLRTVLFEKLRLHERCENKRLPKTVNKQQHSTSEAALLQLQDLHPLPKIILEYRQVHKVKSTFVDGILSCMMSKSYISSSWQQTSAVTGRISAKHPNFQALPRQPLQITRKQYVTGKEEETVTVHPRAMFVPRKGCTFVAADFCQVELRLLAHFSSDPELLRIFTTPQADVFTMLASQWKGLAEDEVTSEDREQAKRVVYSVVYGAGRERLSGILSVSADDARRFQDGFLQTYRDVHQFIQRTVTQSHKQGFVLSIMGRRRTLPYINSPDWAVRMQAERQAVNFVVQGSAADLCKMAMIRIFDLISSSGLLAPRLIAQLHDELLYEVEDSQVQEFAALVKRTMESLQHMDHLGVHLKVPLKVAVSCGKSWGSMSELRLPLTSPPH